MYTFPAFTFLCKHLLRMYRFQNLSQILSQQFELVRLCQERIIFVTLHLLYGAVFFSQ